MNNLLFNVDHWHVRAEEVRTLADSIGDLNARKMLLGIADTYTRLAEHAERMREHSGEGK